MITFTSNVNLGIAVLIRKDYNDIFAMQKMRLSRRVRLAVYFNE
jgi:hypothetical protein